MTEELFKLWLDEVFAKRPGYVVGKPSLLIMDQAPAHSKALSDKMRATHTILIPKGCTPLLQPLDVSINKPFKNSVRNEWRKFVDLPEENHELTKNCKRKRVCFIFRSHW